MRIEGASVLITGANGGLGVEFVRQALERGARTVYAAARTPAASDDPRVIPLPLDVTDDASVAAALRAAPDVDILINNAGVLRRGDLLEAEWGDIQLQIETNLLGPLRTTRAFVDGLRDRRGAVVNVASVLSWVASAGAYSVSKAGLWAATNALRVDLAPAGVQVLGAYLAYTATPMTSGLSDVEKNDPADVVAQILDGLETGAHEVLADDLTRRVRAGLAAPVHVLYPSLPPAE